MRLLGIEMSIEEFDALMVAQNKGKELKVVDGKVIAIERQIAQEELLLNELNFLYSWFEEYDNQVKQYQRSQRLGIEFDKDIATLDKEAQANAKRITEIRVLISPTSDKTQASADLSSNDDLNVVGGKA